MMSMILTKKEWKIICNRIVSISFTLSLSPLTHTHTLSLRFACILYTYVCVSSAKILLWESYYLDQKTIDRCSSNRAVALSSQFFSIVDENQLRKKDVYTYFLSTTEEYSSYTQNRHKNYTEENKSEWEKNLFWSLKNFSKIACPKNRLSD